jgi:hypothetical protein
VKQFYLFMRGWGALEAESIYHEIMILTTDGINVHCQP